MSSQLYKGAPGPGLAGAGSRRTPSAYPPLPPHSDCRLALSTVAPFIFLRKINIKVHFPFIEALAPVCVSLARRSEPRPQGIRAAAACARHDACWRAPAATRGSCACSQWTCRCVLRRTRGGGTCHPPQRATHTPCTWGCWGPVGVVQGVLPPPSEARQRVVKRVFAS